VLTSEAIVRKSPLDSLPDTSSGLLSSAKTKHFSTVGSGPHRIGDRLYYSPRSASPTTTAIAESHRRGLAASRQSAPRGLESVRSAYVPC